MHACTLCMYGCTVCICVHVHIERPFTSCLHAPVASTNIHRHVTKQAYCSPRAHSPSASSFVVSLSLPLSPLYGLGCSQTGNLVRVLLTSCNCKVSMYIHVCVYMLYIYMYNRVHCMHVCGVCLSVPLYLGMFWT